MTPAAKRLDVFLRNRGRHLDLNMRLAMLRQIAETLQYAHEHRLYHQTLSPQTIRVTIPTSLVPQIKIFDWQSTRRDSSATGGSRSSDGGSLHLDLFDDQHSLLYMAPEAMVGTAYNAAKLHVFASTVGRVASWSRNVWAKARPVWPCWSNATAGKACSKSPWSPI